LTGKKEKGVVAQSTEFTGLEKKYIYLLEIIYKLHGPDKYKNS
jgi:hypothetical protein